MPSATPYTLNHFRDDARTGRRHAMLTCYDYTTATQLAAAGVKLLLVGDSAAGVILGHPTTLPVPLDFMIQITAAVKRGAPDALVFADMPFGSCATRSSGIKNTIRMVKESHCDCVKIETTRGHIGLVQALADSGVAVFAHLGLIPQAVGLTGGYKAQGKTSLDAYAIADLAGDLVNAGAAGILLEAVPPEVSELITQQLDVPVIGCGAGKACHAHVVVLQDLLGITPRQPKFVQVLGDGGISFASAVKKYVKSVESGTYPGKAHVYPMPPGEARLLREEASKWGFEIP